MVFYGSLLISRFHSGLVTEIKSQGNCGSCSAFAATSLHETCMIKAGAKKEGMDLSEQYLIDCGYNGNTMNGCDGAVLSAYTKLLIGMNGVSPHEAHMLYQDNSPSLTCPSRPKIWKTGARVHDMVYDHNCNADKLKMLVAKYGAVGVTAYVSDRAFREYEKGVFNECR